MCLNLADTGAGRTLPETKARLQKVTIPTEILRDLPRSSDASEPQALNFAR
jgi:hypothetical protein